MKFPSSVILAGGCRILRRATVGVIVNSLWSLNFFFPFLENCSGFLIGKDFNMQARLREMRERQGNHRVLNGIPNPTKQQGEDRKESFDLERLPFHLRAV